MGSPALPPPLWFAGAYNFSWEGQVWPQDKYAALRRRVLQSGLCRVDEIGLAPMARRSELRLGHSLVYLDRLEAMTAQPQLGLFEFEAPCTREVLDGYYSMTGGTLAACRAALARAAAGERPFAANLGGGFHHAFPWKGEGFCAINDVVVALRVLIESGEIDSAAVIDLDVHQGNGTARAFEFEKRVFTCSLHQNRNYPVKQSSDLDVGFPDRAGGDLYLSALRSALEQVADFAPQFVIYLAGADPYKHDRLGQLSLSIDELAERDRLVFAATVERGLPVAAVLGGGYPPRQEDVVEIHYRMLSAGLGRLPGRR
ncbi:MAG: histone deacetylase [Planctomycetota bacterium]|nr:MAG: histone deacetylase [Planctomycetota bacterium]